MSFSILSILPMTWNSSYVLHGRAVLLRHRKQLTMHETPLLESPQTLKFKTLFLGFLIVNILYSTCFIPEHHSNYFGLFQTFEVTLLDLVERSC